MSESNGAVPRKNAILTNKHLKFLNISINNLQGFGRKSLQERSARNTTDLRRLDTIFYLYRFDKATRFSN